MNYRLYIDVFFVTVWLVDFVILLGTSCLLHKGGQIRRCLLLALGAALAEVLLYLVLPSYKLYRILMLAVIHPSIAYGLIWNRHSSIDKRCIKKQWQALLSCYLLVMGLYLFVGGLQTLFLTWFPRDKGIGIWLILLAFMGVFICVLQRIRGRQTGQECEVELWYEGNCLIIKAYHDTGNLLRDPLTGKPVSVADENIFQKLEEIKAETEENPQKDAISFYEKTRRISFRTAGNNQSFMPVLTIDKMVIQQGVQRKQILQPMIGAAPAPLFTNGEVQLLLHNDLL